MHTIAIISEGPTDQVVLRNVFVGYFNNKYFDFNYLQPKPDPSKASGYTEGNWDQVFKYIQTDRFRDAFDDNEFVLIQIDTDFLYGDSVPAEYKIDVKDETQQPLSDEAVVENVKQLLIALMNEGEDGFYDYAANRILFAISHQSVECWLLPIYFPTQKAKASKSANCRNTLDVALNKLLGFTLDKKLNHYYDKASQPYRKRKDLLKLFPLNPSFDIFMRRVQELVPVNERG